ncbi:unnamed protein product [Urochloa decumbens]|uniref:Transcription factor n=1 Tax=Urochloa decumbens TaxID=240449 RepID=A0ABC9AQ72_9POAL
MDRLVWPATFCGPPSPPSSFFSGVGNHHYLSALDSQSCNVREHEQWLAGGCDVLSKHDDADLMDDAGANPPPAPPAKTRRRGRMPGPRTATASLPISHVEAERQRRDRLNRRLCDLRAAVPTVSRLDKASLLEDAVAYIAELRRRVEQLEQAAAEVARRTAAEEASVKENMALEARMIGPEAAALRLTTATTAARHAPARLMAALQELDLPVQHACVCRFSGATVQDVVVDVPSAGLREEGRLRAAVLRGLIQRESG